MEKTVDNKIVDKLGQTINNPRRRVICYITRNRQDILVFEHDDPGLDADVQVVAGGIDAGETPEQAALRETWEEAGLKIEKAVFLGELKRQTSDHVYKFQHWFFFWLEAPPSTPDAWSHTVSAGEDDAGMVYNQCFVEIKNAKTNFREMEMFEQLKQKIREVVQ